MSSVVQRLLRYAIVFGIALAGFLVSLVLIIHFSRPRSLEPGAAREAIARPSELVLDAGSDVPESLFEHAVFPRHRYVIDGELEWMPLLETWVDRRYARASKDVCQPLRDQFLDDDVCHVEYALATRPTSIATDRHVITHVRATVSPGTLRSCRDYVECRLPAFLGSELPLPTGFDESVVLDRVVYGRLDSTHEQMREELRTLRHSLQRRDSQNFDTAPGPIRRMQHLLDLQHAQRIAVLSELLAGQESAEE